MALTAVVLSMCSTNERSKQAALSGITQAVDEIKIVDTHEHLVTEEGRKQIPKGLFYLMGNYFTADLQSAGLSGEDYNFVFNPANPLNERWERFLPYWEKTKNTGYGLCIKIAARDLFGINDITDETYADLDRKLTATDSIGWYRHVLRNRSGIEVCIVDPLDVYVKMDNNYSNEYFVKVKRFDIFIQAGERGFNEAGSLTGIKINSLADYLKAVDTLIYRAVREERIAGIKTGLAYSRSMYFEDVPFETAEKLFYRSLIKNEKISAEELKQLQDHLMHHMLSRINGYSLPFQVHTGMLAGIKGRNPIENTNARLLSNLFSKYPGVKFVIFHGSYPYMAELTNLAKSFPNVYIDMCWMYIISPSASRQYLEEWLFNVPANKIMAFGGDMGNSVEWVYGHAVLARKIISEVLFKMVNDGYYTESESIAIAKMILRDNALNLYNIKKSGDRFYIGE
jgi:predicted TIM-barrel fold metal-dependent hydrolase